MKTTELHWADLALTGKQKRAYFAKLRRQGRYRLEHDVQGRPPTNFNDRFRGSPVPIIKSRHRGAKPVFQLTVPLAAPVFEPKKTYSAAEVECFREQLHALECENDRGVVCFTPDEIRLILDSGASISISNCLSDFISPPSKVQSTTVRGIGAGLQVKGIGTVRYILSDGRTLEIENVLYVPDCPVRLLCPQQLTDEQDIGFHIDKEDGETVCYLTFPSDDDGSEPTRLYAHFDPATNLPLLHTKSGVSTCTQGTEDPLYEGESFRAMLAAFTANPAISDTSAKKQASSAMTADEQAPDPATVGVTTSAATARHLTARQRRLLQWHERLGHVGMEQIVEWSRLGLIPKDLATGNDVPLCRTCQEAKARKRPVGNSHVRHQSDDIKPGEVASVDQLESRAGGRLLTSAGMPTKRRYVCVTIFVDHKTRFIFPWFQESTGTKETVEAKRQYEAFGKRYGRVLCHIHSDDGTFKAKDFKIAAEDSNVKQSFSGVGAHWQNGIAERSIGAVTSLARSMLSHSMRRWPDVIDESFWTFAVRQACNILNMMPRSRKAMSNWELFTGEKPPLSPSDFHVFGCPVYVLDARLQDSKKLPKWHNRAHLGAYVGHSDVHSGNVLWCTIRRRHIPRPSSTAWWMTASCLYPTARLRRMKRIRSKSTFGATRSLSIWTGIRQSTISLIHSGTWMLLLLAPSASALIRHPMNPLNKQLKGQMILVRLSHAPRKMASATKPRLLFAREPLRRRVGMDHCRLPNPK